MTRRRHATALDGLRAKSLENAVQSLLIGDLETVVREIPHASVFLLIPIPKAIAMITIGNLLCLLETPVRWRTRGRNPNDKISKLEREAILSVHCIMVRLDLGKMRTRAHLI